MRKILSSLLLLILCSALHSQSNRYLDSAGVFHWQYHYSVTRDFSDSTQALITFVFVNGEKQCAISLRHECFHSKIEWVEIEEGTLSSEKKVEAITANLAPNQVVVWKFKTSSKSPKTPISVEESAILIMNETFAVRKERIPAQIIN